jgi:diguanylate cyclase (GGDEF)-like protein
VSKAPDRPAISLPDPPTLATPRSPRTMSPGLLVLAVLGFLMLAVLYMESAAVKGVGGRIVGELAFLVPLALSVVLCGAAYRKSRGTEKRFWLVASALNAVLLVSELYYVWWIVSYGGPPPGIYAPFQVLHTVAAAFFYLLLASMTRLADAPLRQRWRWALDVIGVGIVAYVSAVQFLEHSLFAGMPGATAATALIGAVYPTWGLLMIAGMLWTLFRPGASRWRVWERMVAVSLMIYAAGITAWPVWYAAFQRSPSSSTEVSVLDLVLVLGHYLFTIAAAERLIRRDQAWPLRRSAPPRRLSTRTTTYAALTLTVLALPVLVWLAASAPSGSLDQVVFAVGAVLLGLLMTARTVLDAIENGRLFHRSVTDPLTGLFNHRYFHERLAAYLELTDRFDEPLAVISLEIDDFDAVNRRYGHGVGDEVLQRVGAALRTACRTSDVVCRVGGDEFSVIVRDCDAAGALATALRIQTELRRIAPPDAKPVTASIGIACSPVNGQSADTLTRLADGAAYWVKQHGKDQAIVYDPRFVNELSAEDHIRAMEERTQLGTVRALAVAVDARNEGTRTRSSVVGGLAANLARQLGLAEERVRLIETAALLHDVGMIALGDDIIDKPGPLDADEWTQVRQHPALGEQIVGATMPDIALPWIRHHHERWDGHGYPDRLRAVAIPLEARIIGVCDAWAAMTSTRPYRPALSVEEAAREMRSESGTHFDPAVVDVFLASLGEELASA